jgi:hypothetical protein
MAAMARKSPKLTAAKRKALPKSQFAIPSKKAYPIDTPGRARDALARVAQNGTPAQKTTVRHAVKRKYPSIKVAGK